MNLGHAELVIVEAEGTHGCESSMAQKKEDTCSGHPLPMKRGFQSASVPLAMLGIRDDHAEFLRLGFKKSLGGVSRSIGESAKAHLEVDGILCCTEGAGNMQTREAIAAQVHFHIQFVAFEAIVVEFHADAFSWFNREN